MIGHLLVCLFIVAGLPVGGVLLGLGWDRADPEAVATQRLHDAEDRFADALRGEQR